MCEILHYSIDASLRLCNSEGRVGAVLHIYNALRQLGFIDNVPLLDVPMAGVKYHAIYDLCVEILKNMAFLKL
jgi:hypothetical protein